MANGISGVVEKVTDPAYWCIGIVVGIAPLVVPAPYGYVIGVIVGVALVLGLVLLERMDKGDVDEQEETGRRGSARFARPMFAQKVRFVVGRALARVAL